MGLSTRALYRGQSLSDRKRRHEALVGYLFVLPAILGILLLVVGPMLATLAISLTDWSVLGNTTWVGLDNYIRLYTADPNFYPSLRATLYFAFGSVFLRIIYAFLVAMLLNMDVRGKALFRTDLLPALDRPGRGLKHDLDLGL